MFDLSSARRRTIVFMAMTSVAVSILLGACSSSERAAVEGPAAASEPTSFPPTQPVADEPQVDATATAAPTPTPVPISLGGRESSRGPGSLIWAAQQHFFSLEDFDGPWFPVAAAISEIDECQSPHELAVVGGAMSLNDEAGQEAGFFNQVTLYVEIHEDSEAAAERARLTIEDERPACQAASYEAAVANTTGLYNVESPNPAGVVSAPIVDHPGVRTALFEVVLSGPGVSLPLQRTLSTWAVDQTVFHLGVITHDETNAEVTANVIAAIEATGAATVATIDPLVDRSMNIIRAATVEDDVVADFYNYTAPLQLVELAETPPCNQAYETPASMSVAGPTWLIRTSSSAVFQGAVVFESEAAAAREVDRVERTGASCLGQLGPSMIPGTNTVTSTATTRELIEGVSIVQFSADIDQMVEGQNGTVQGDARILWTVAQVDNVVLEWGFIGLAGDEPDLHRLMRDSVRMAEAAS